MFFYKLLAGEITQEDADDEWDTVYREYSKTNSRSYVQNYKNKIENGENNLNIYHVPKTPNRK